MQKKDVLSHNITTKSRQKEITKQRNSEEQKQTRKIQQKRSLGIKDHHKSRRADAPPPSTPRGMHCMVMAARKAPSFSRSRRHLNLKIEASGGRPVTPPCQPAQGEGDARPAYLPHACLFPILPSLPPPLFSLS